MDAYHIHEWVWGGLLNGNYALQQALGLCLSGTRASKEDFLTYLEINCPAFVDAQALTNAAKHFNRAGKKSGLHRGAFSSAFSRDFDISYLWIERQSGHRQNAEDFLQELVDRSSAISRSSSALESIAKSASARNPGSSSSAMLVVRPLTYREPIRGPGDACNLGAFYSRLKKEPGELEARRAFVTAFRASEKEDLRATNRSGSVAGDDRSCRSREEVVVDACASNYTPLAEGCDCEGRGHQATADGADGCHLTE